MWAHSWVSWMHEFLIILQARDHLKPAFWSHQVGVPQSPFGTGGTLRGDSWGHNPTPPYGENVFTFYEKLTDPFLVST